MALVIQTCPIHEVGTVRLPMLNLIRVGVKRALAITMRGTKCMRDQLGWDVRHGVKDILKGRH